MNISLDANEFYDDSDGDYCQLKEKYKKLLHDKNKLLSHIKEKENEIHEHKNMQYIENMESLDNSQQQLECFKFECILGK
ncbi:hypothetical protein MXB_4021 [Myxobolus squamalis]|nr:hypothetical protein MXB_4021 [Myxobolus squamalis]